jgi:hypothetical protein
MENNITVIVLQQEMTGKAKKQLFEAFVRNMTKMDIRTNNSQFCQEALPSELSLLKEASLAHHWVYLQGKKLKRHEESRVITSANFSKYGHTSNLDIHFLSTPFSFLKGTRNM